MLGSERLITKLTLSFISSATACSIVRGNPSMSSDWPALTALTASLITIFIIILSGTSAPASMYFLASMPNSVPFLTCCRSSSPVLTCRNCGKSCKIFPEMVPFPPPGLPRRMRAFRSTDGYRLHGCVGSLWGRDAKVLIGKLARRAPLWCRRRWRQ